MIERYPESKAVTVRGGERDLHSYKEMDRYTDAAKNEDSEEKENVQRYAFILFTFPGTDLLKCALCGIVAS